MQRETELVIALCRMPLSDASRDRVTDLAASIVDWDSFFGLAERWELEPPVMSNLRANFAAVVPPAVLHRASQRERESRAIALSRTLVLMDLVKALRAVAVDAIVLKGPAVAIAAFADPSLRSFADIDLLVRRSDLVAARDLLISRGYAKQYEDADEPAIISDGHAIELSLRSTKVELHWQLLPRHLRFAIDPRELWLEARTLTYADCEMRVLAPHHLFLYLCAHGAKHEWERPRWICDVAQIARWLNEDDADAVAGLAKRVGALRLLALGLRVARDLLGEDAPSFRRVALPPRSDTTALVQHVERRLGLIDATPTSAAERFMRLDPRLRSLVFWARCREGVVDRIACLAKVLFVPTKNDGSMGAIGWIVRPLRLAAHAVRRLVAQ